MRPTVVAVLLALGSHSFAQSWSITAHAPVVGTATASANSIFHFPSQVTNSATLPVGPVMPWTGLACSASLGTQSGSSNVTWGPSVTGTSAPLAFTADLFCAAQGDYIGGTGSTNGNARIDLRLLAPQPASGHLWVHVFGSTNMTGGSVSSRIDLDVHADGIIEVSAQTSFPSPPPPLVVPLQIPATGAVIRLTYNHSASVSTGYVGTSGSLSASRRIEAHFVPPPIASVAPFATFIGASTMSVYQGSPSTVSLSIAGPGITPVMMAGGGTAISVPLWPYVTVLVSPDVLIAAPPFGLLTVPLPPLPPGTAFFMQGVVVDSFGTLRGTNSVRFLWL